MFPSGRISASFHAPSRTRCLLPGLSPSAAAAWLSIIIRTQVSLLLAFATINSRMSARCELNAAIDATVGWAGGFWSSLLS